MPIPQAESGFANCIRVPPLGARFFRLPAFAQGLRPYGLRPTPRALSGFDFAGYLTQGLRPYGPPGLPCGLCRGSISPASPPKSWADVPRPLYPPTTPRRPVGKQYWSVGRGGRRGAPFLGDRPDADPPSRKRLRQLYPRTTPRRPFLPASGFCSGAAPLRPSAYPAGFVGV